MSVGFYKNRKVVKKESICPRVLHDFEFRELSKSKAQLENEEAQTINQQTLDEKIKEGVFIEPWKYQSTTQTAKSKEDDGYLKIVTNDQAQFTSNYFWVEDLHNWACFRIWTDCPCVAGNIQWNFNYYYASTAGGYSTQRQDWAYAVIYPGGRISVSSAFNIFGKTAVMDGNPDWYKIDMCQHNNATYVSTYKDAIWSFIYQNCITPSKRSTGTVGTTATASVVNNSDGANPSVYWNDQAGQMVRDINISIFRDVGMTACQLCLWNGIDAFLPVNNFQIADTKNGMSVVQNMILAFVSQYHGSIVKHRGEYCANPNDLEKDPGWHWGHNDNAFPKGPNDEEKAGSWYQSPLSVVQALVLENQTKYSIYDKDNFQCRRGKPYTIFFTTDMGNYFEGWSPRSGEHNRDLCRSDFLVNYHRAAVRQGIYTGCPGVFRTATGELALATLILYGGVINAFGDQTKETDVNLINDLCKDYFGDGKDKNIATDWLKFNARINTNEEFATTVIANPKGSSLDKTMQEQTNIKSSFAPKITLSTNDVAVTIEEPTSEDYAEKW